MKELVLTKDGSHTISIPEQKVMYHSANGAIGESVHVFLEAGFSYVYRRSKQPDAYAEERGPVRIFEMGFGTGLNAFLTAVKAQETKTPVHYTAVETWPLSVDEAAALNYPSVLGHRELFAKLHHSPWNNEVKLSEHFTIKKQLIDLFDFRPGSSFDLIYYDAFAPSAQPELWTEAVFKKLFLMTKPNGVLVTYCSKSVVRRAMQAAGFAVAKLPGPRGKREMLRATVPAAAPPAAMP